jgi:hypothetical protein
VRHSLSLGKVLFAAGALLLASSQAGRAATVSLSTSVNGFGDAGGSFSLVGVLNTVVPTTPSLLSWGTFQFSTLAGNSTIVNLTVAPTVNGLTTNLVFVGHLTTIGAAYVLNFNPADTAGAFSINNVNTANVSYTALLFNGYDFAVQSQFQLNAGTSGKTTNLAGFVQAVPEPATAALIGFSLLGAALLPARRKRTQVV